MSPTLFLDQLFRGLGGCTTYTFTYCGYGRLFIYTSVSSSASTIYCSPFAASPVRLPIYFHFIFYASFMVSLSDSNTLADFRRLSTGHCNYFRRMCGVDDVGKIEQFFILLFIFYKLIQVIIFCTVYWRLIYCMIYIFLFKKLSFTFENLQCTYIQHE